MTEDGYNSISLTLPDEMVSELDKEAGNTGRSRSEVARAAIADKYRGES